MVYCRSRSCVEVKRWVEMDMYISSLSPQGNVKDVGKCESVNSDRRELWAEQARVVYCLTH